MPPLTIASAVSLMSCALTSHPKWFQLFQTIGGVRASLLSSGRAGWCATASPKPRHMNVVNRGNTEQLLSGVRGQGSGVRRLTRVTCQREHRDAEHAQHRSPHQVDGD